MFRYKSQILLLTVTLLLITVSCSTGIPTSPEYDTNPLNASSPSEGVGLMGAYTINLSTNPLSAEIVPIRKTNITDSLETLDITNFLTYHPCPDCVKIQSIGINENNQIVMSIGIKHPFDIGNPFEPISGKNRIDLHVFNIEGILAIVGGTSGTKTFSLNEIIALDGLDNQSGYTAYLDPYLDGVLPTAATLHPYILHFDNYDDGNYMPGFFPTGFSDVYHPTGNLIMAQGSDHDFKDYILNIEMGVNYQFLFAVGCTYGISAFDYSERFNPIYRIPQFNKKAASEVFVTVTDNAMLEGNPLGTATVQVKVLDYNQGVEIGTAINKMTHDSSVSKIVVNVPDIMTIPIEEIDPVEISGDPIDPLNPLLFEYTITNELNAASGTYLGLVSVEDSFPLGTNTHPFLEAHDAGHRVPIGQSALTGLFDILAFVTYQVFEYEVLQVIQFETIAIMPNSRSYACAAVVDDLIYVIGGIHGIDPLNPRSDDIDAYDPVANTWDTTLAPMPTPRAGMAVEAVDALIYVIGGLLDAGSGVTDVMEVYDTTDDTWTTRPTPLPGYFRHGMGTAVRGTIIYVFGGKHPSENELNIVYRFDTELESWGALNPMVAKRYQFACVLKDDFVYVIGGNPVVGPGSDLTPLVEVYDIVGGEWAYPPTGPSIADIAPDPYEAILAPCWENVEGKIVFAGGAYDMDLLEDKVYIYNEVTESFLHIGQLVVPRASFASASWNNQIFLFGGATLYGSPPAPYLTPTAEKGTL